RFAMRKTKKGFTLIEIIVVVAVLAIIAVIAIPVVSGVIKNAEKTAAETPIGYLEAKDCTLLISKKVAKECGITINEADFKNATFTE
ncbi:MAG: prepilin-type N-terminal cleavage/methylation domain-containing protein, partial [Coprobacillus sp.]